MNATLFIAAALKLVRKATWAPISVLVFHAIIAKTPLRTPLDFTMHFLGGAAAAYFFLHAVDCFAHFLGQTTVIGRYLFSFAWCFTGVFAVLLVFVGMGWSMKRNIGKGLHSIATDLSRASDTLAASSRQVSVAGQTLAEGASEQAASLEETSASLEEMASMVQRNAEHADEANTLASQARQSADQGFSDMQAMSQAMQDLKMSSDDIAKIIKTIDEIAFQTNILALNAAVEAARAGEAGMGFAVVADEVRALAQRSAHAARETANKIEGTITKTAQGVQIAAKVGLSLQEIVSKARQVNALVAEVATASKEQTRGIQQLNTAVSQMDKVTQTNAASAEESASAARDLHSQADVLNQSVTRLLAMVSGAANHHGFQNRHSGSTVTLEQPVHAETYSSMFQSISTGSSSSSQDQRKASRNERPRAMAA